MTRAEVAVGELLVVADIRPADTGPLDGNLQLPGGRFLNAPRLLKGTSVVRINMSKAGRLLTHSGVGMQ